MSDCGRGTELRQGIGESCLNRVSATCIYRGVEEAKGKQRLSEGKEVTQAKGQWRKVRVEQTLMRP